MTGGRGRAPVVVAVDDAGTARDAVEWASSEAAARGCPLRIVHVYRPPLPVDFCGTVPSPESVFTLRAAIEELLAAEVARARSIASDVEVSAVPVQGSPVRALLDVAAGADLLVVGRRARTGLRDRLARSVSRQVTAYAACPVVVVRPRPDEDPCGWSPPRVVVGVDDTGPGRAAMRFALRAARQRGVPLVAVRAWTPDRPADLEAVSAPAAQTELVAHRALERVLRRQRGEFPDVSVHALVARSDPARALVTHSEGAAMVVVGSCDRGQSWGAVSGAVGRSVLRLARCPLAVVGAVHAGATGNGPGQPGLPDRAHREQRDRWHPA